MQNTIDKYRSTLPQSQGRAIERALLSESSRLRAGSVEELREEFRRRMQALLDQEEKLVIDRLEILPDSPREAELINKLFEDTAADLASLFIETDLIDDLVRRQAQLFDAMLSTAEEDVARYRTLVGYQEQAETVRAGVVTVFGAKNHGDPAVAEQFPRLYVDPRTGVQLDSSNQMVFSSRAEGMTLPVEKQSIIKISAIQEVQQSGVRPSGVGTIPGIWGSTDGERRNQGRLSYMIDDSLETAWIGKIRRDEIAVGGARFHMHLGFSGGLQHVGLVEITSSSAKPAYLSAIYYTGEGQTPQQVSLSERVLLDGTTRIQFNQVAASSLELFFVQEDYTTDDGIEYEIGISDIRVGRSRFSDIGVFAGRPKKGGEVRKASLFAESTTLDGETSDSESPVVEYYVNYLERSSSGNTLVERSVDVVPAGASQNRELVEVDNDGRARMRFNPDPTASVDVYDGSRLLVSGTDYTIDYQGFDEEGLTSVVLTGGNAGGISQLVVVYSLNLSSSGAPEYISSRDGLVKYNRDGSITFTDTANIVETEVSPVVLMRRVSQTSLGSVVQSLAMAVEYED